MPRIIADAIDRLISVEMRFAGDLPRGVIRRLYEAARDVQGGEPLVYLAARRLLDRVARGDVVVVVTGSGSRFGLHKGETDGPLGAASLGRALDFGLGARMVFVCDEPHRDPIVATVEAAGLSVIDAERFERRPHTALVETHPPGREAGARFARDLLDRVRPAAVVFIEKTGPNAKDVHHTILGTAKDPGETGHAFFLADLARQRGIATLGVGDGGNEIGNGLIYEAVRTIQPYGARCRCPCGDGLATVTPTDVLVSASVSNWGAYGIAAQLAYELKDPELFQDEELEDFMLRRCVAAGGTDGAYAAQVLRVDGTSARTQRALVAMLREIVENGLRTVTRGF
ncbi:MAG: glutamate cyclase domain-containing protein [Candidatus Rokuibacteriota bacterium]